MPSAERRLPIRLRRAATLAGVLLTLVLVPPRVSEGAGTYRTLDVQSLRLIVDSEWAGQLAPGYVPIRVEIVNLGEAREIELSAVSRKSSRGPWTTGGIRSRPWQSTLTVRQTVALARGDRVRLTLSVPVFADSESIDVSVRENGEVLERLGVSAFQSAVAPERAAALVVAESGGRLATLAPDWLRSLPPVPFGVAGVPVTPLVPTPGGTSPVVVTSGAAGRTVKTDYVLDPQRLPSSWLGYTSVRAVLIGPGEWALLDDSQRAALLTWVACGGDLILVDGGIQTILGSGQPSSLDPATGAVRYLFGHVHLVASDTITASGLDTVIRSLPAAPSVNLALPANRALDWGGPFERGFRLPIPGVGGVPARAYLVILLLFGVLIGPVNYLVLRRYRQQALVVLTAPLISALFIVMIVVYVMAAEGFEVHGRAATLTMLDQARRQASTRAFVSLYAAGTTPSGGLRFPRDVAVFPLGSDEGGGGRERLGIDLSEAQRFVSGLVAARSPANLETIALRPARERLQVVRDGGGLAVVNGLGSTITKLLYRSPDRLLTLAGPLEEGGKAPLRDAPPGDELLSPDQAAYRFQRGIERQPAGSYLAVLERSPFWEPGIDGVDERDSVHVVMGLLEAQP